MTKYGAGNYVACDACGRLLRIEWAARSIVCSCGARITPPERKPPDPQAPPGDPASRGRN